MIKVLYAISIYWLISVLFTNPKTEESNQFRPFSEQGFNFLYFGILTLLILFIVLTVFFYRKFKENTRLNTMNELLRNEINHRVKNNFQLIISLLNIQIRQLENQETISILKKNVDRVKTFSIIHSILYMRDSQEIINMEYFISRLIEGYKSVNGEEVVFYIVAKDIQLNVDLALPLGLIINELLTNTFKHAFFENKVEKPLVSYEDKPKTVKILLSQINSKELELIYQDSGPGMLDGGFIKSKKRMGLKLIEGLSKQMNGSVFYSKENKQLVIRLKTDQKL